MSNPGDLDTTFGTGGRVTTDFSNNSDVGRCVALQPDGKIILGGYARIGSNDNFALARYNSNGSLDTTFGTNGRVTTDFSNNTDQGYSVALQPDGKIILGGFTLVGSNRNFGLARYYENGSLDTTFGTNGRVTTDFSNNTDQGYSVALQPDGKIILGGYAYIGSNNNFALARYNSNGSLDTTFGTNGRVTTDFSNNNDASWSVALQPDGKIILGGYARIGSNDNFALARYYENGSLDTTFGTNGRVTTDFSNNTDQGYSVALQPDGKIILGGYAYIGSNNNFALARYLPGTILSKPFSYFKAAGYTDAQLKEEGFTTGYFRDAGYTLLQTKAVGFTDQELRVGGFTVNDFKAAGYTLSQTKAAGFTDSELRVGGYTVTNFKEVGYTDPQIKAVGFTVNDFKAAGYTLSQTKAAGFTDSELKVGGYTVTDFRAAGYTDQQIRALGFTAAEFRGAGYTLSQTKAAGFTDSELRVGGYTVTNFKEVGYTDPQIQAVGFTAAEFRGAGYSDAQLQNAGFTDQDIKLSYIISEGTEKLTFDDAGSILLMTSQDDFTLNIDVTGKNMKYFNLETNAYESYVALTISSNGWIGFISIIGDFSSGQSNQSPINTLRYLSFDARSTIKYYFDSNSNLMISTIGSFFGSSSALPFAIIMRIEPNGKITIDYKNVGIGSSRPIIGWVGNNTSVLTDSVFYSTFDGIQNFNAANINGKTLVFNFTNSNTLPVSNICFLENSLVSTDQGFIKIQNIDEDIHTINNKEIICLTKTVTEEPHLICIEKNALGKNIPSQDTILSYNHKILCNGELVSASELLYTNNKIYKVRYTGETLYNILMKDYEEIEVNGLKCETLHPQNRVAHLYLLLKEQPEEYHQYIIQNYNARFSSVGQM
jgi:uncharacterized delta-60 repeat protein